MILFFFFFLQYDIANIQFEVTTKIKKQKTEKSGPNPIAEEAIKAARASSALQSFGNSDRRGKKDRKVSFKILETVHNS